MCFPTASVIQFTVVPSVSVSGYFQKYKEFEKSVRVEEIDGVKLVKTLAVKMEEVFRKKAEATRVGKILNIFEKRILFCNLLFTRFILFQGKGDCTLFNYKSGGVRR